ncbi:MAG TPA: MBL fold metallo-hydrolase [Candidatus Hydrogenedentes bacterium]|nr:MBL fold metallo-hydrolase [Candidatus Hydrogenedentota bacterium]
MTPAGQSDWLIAPISLPTPFPVGEVNVYLFRGERLTLFDAGVKTDEAWDALNRGVAELGYAVRDIGRVVLTHHHFDHIGLLGRLIRECRVEVWGHPETLPQIQYHYGYDESHTTYYRALLKEFGVPESWIVAFLDRREVHRKYLDLCTVDRPLYEHDYFDGFRIVHVPGHSPTDTLYLHESGGFTVTGDHIIQGVNPNPIVRRPLPGQARQPSLVQYQQSLLRTRYLPMGRCYPGHGPVFTDHVAVVDHILERQERRNEKVLEIMRDQARTPWMVARDMYGNMSAGDFIFCVSVAIGHLELLEHRGVLRSWRDHHGVLWYQRKPAMVRHAFGISGTGSQA